MNPYEPVAIVENDAPLAISSGLHVWEGRRFFVTAEQLPRSLWLVGCISIQVDDEEVVRFIKWRWNMQAQWILAHQGNRVVAILHCSGAHRIHCRLFVEDVATGESLVLAKWFWFGLMAVGAITTAMTWALARKLAV